MNKIDTAHQEPGFIELVKSSFCITCNNFHWLALIIFLRLVLPVMSAALVGILTVRTHLTAITLAVLTAWLVASYLNFGYFRLMLRLGRGERGGIRFLLGPIDRVFLYFTLVNIEVFAGFYIGLLLCLFPGIYFLSRSCFAGLLIIDGKAGPLSAFSKSVQLTKNTAKATIWVIAASVLAGALLLFTPASDEGIVIFLWIAICYLYARAQTGLTWKPAKPSILRILAALITLALSTFLSALIALIGFRCTFESRFVPSAAMNPTISVGDRIIVEKSQKYGLSQLDRGDIVIFYPPPSELPNQKDLSSEPLHVLGRLTGLPFLPYEPAYIKRIIGLPGDKLRIVSGAGVYINEKLLDEPYVIDPPAYTLRVMGDIGNTGLLPYPYRASLSPEQEQQSIVVPPGKLFVLGDNRNNSQDSHVWGFLEENRVIGRAWLKYQPNFIFFE